MIIARIKTNGKEKLLAVCKRLENGKLGETIFADWNSEPNTLRIYDRTGSASLKFKEWKDAIKFIFSC